MKIPERFPIGSAVRVRDAAQTVWMRGMVVAAPSPIDRIIDVGADEPVAAPIGLIHADWSDDAESSARRNLVAAGFEPKRYPNGYTSWVNVAAGVTYNTAIRFDPDIDGREWPVCASVVEAYGHDLDPCNECGLPVDASHRSAHYGRCFNCDFWCQTLAETGLVVVDDVRRRVVFTVASVQTGPKGHGGQRFAFEPVDGGGVIVANNVWFRGEVPEHFYDRLPVTHRRVPLPASV